MTWVLKRALPFAMTLLVGTALGNGIGYKDSTRQKHVHQTDVTATELSSTKTDYLRRSEIRERTPLNIRFQPHNRYTLAALKNQTSGVVRLLVRFNSDGTTSVLERLSTLPDGLTREAELIAEGTVFDPATLNGQPVPVTMEMNYIFSSSETFKLH